MSPFPLMLYRAQLEACRGSLWCLPGREAWRRILWLSQTRAPVAAFYDSSAVTSGQSACWKWSVPPGQVEVVE